MSNFLTRLKALFVEGAVADTEKIKNDPGWEFFTYPKCRKCGEGVKITVADDTEYSGKNSYRIKVECDSCGIKEIIG